MTSHEKDKLLLELANTVQLDSLPEKLREGLLRVKTEEAARIEAEAEARRKEEEERRREEAERARKRDEERRKLLCTGEWGEKVPLKRRFALCRRMGVKFVGFVGQEKDPSKWVPEEEFCAIDLVRGYKSPYWGYFGPQQVQLDAFYTERVRPVLEAGNDDELVRFLRCEWDFFEIREDEKDEPFEVLDYKVETVKNSREWSWAIRRDEEGNLIADKVVVTGCSPLLTFKEHQENLRKEFDK